MLMYNNVYRLLIISGLEYNNFSSVEMKENIPLLLWLCCGHGHGILFSDENEITIW